MTRDEENNRALVVTAVLAALRQSCFRRICHRGSSAERKGRLKDACARFLDRIRQHLFLSRRHARRGPCESAGVRLRWRPFLLGPIFAAQGWDRTAFEPSIPPRALYVARHGAALRKARPLPCAAPILSRRTACFATQLAWAEFPRGAPRRLLPRRCSFTPIRGRTQHLERPRFSRADSSPKRLASPRTCWRRPERMKSRRGCTRRPRPRGPRAFSERRFRGGGWRVVLGATTVSNRRSTRRATGVDDGHAAGTSPPKRSIVTPGISCCATSGASASAS